MDPERAPGEITRGNDIPAASRSSEWAPFPLHVLGTPPLPEAPACTRGWYPTELRKPDAILACDTYLSANRHVGIHIPCFPWDRDFEKQCRWERTKEGGGNCAVLHIYFV